MIFITIQNTWKVQINSLGISLGDTVLVRASLKAISSVLSGEETAKAIISALLDSVGPNGNIIGLSFSSNYIIFRKNQNSVYTTMSDTNTGGLANALLKWPGSLRSTHPTNSFVSIGPDSEFILGGHTVDTFCFYPISKIMELNGKMLLIGCVNESPGFSTIHLVQHDLGLSTKSIMSNRIGAYYRNDNNEILWFRKKDIPGCSRGFHKFYPYYKQNNGFKEGYIGDAHSICINAKDSYAIEYPLIKNNPRFPLCNDPFCLDCRGSWYYNIQDWPSYYMRSIGKYLKGKIGF